MSKSNECLLKRVEELEKEAKEFGFYWEHFNQLMDQIKSECSEIEEAKKNNDQRHLKEEIGDLLQAVVSLAIFCNFDPYETLLESIEKCEKRYHAVVKFAKMDGHSHLRNQPMDVLMGYWNRAKKI